MEFKNVADFIPDTRYEIPNTRSHMTCGTPDCGMVIVLVVVEFFAVSTMEPEEATSPVMRANVRSLPPPVSEMEVILTRELSEVVTLVLVDELYVGPSKSVIELDAK